MSKHGVTVWRVRIGWRWFVRDSPRGFHPDRVIVKQDGWALTKKAAKRRASLQQRRIWDAA